MPHCTGVSLLLAILLSSSAGVVAVRAADQAETVAVPDASARDACPVTEPVRATAPPDPRADPVTGYWHRSADTLLWAPAAPPGTTPTAVGRYWVRPEGTRLFVTARRLDGSASPVTFAEPESSHPSGFFFGGVALSSEGCWELTARAGPSEVTFVTRIRYAIEVFALRPHTRITWSREVGHIEAGATRLTVTALVLEDPASVTQAIRGARIVLIDDRAVHQLWEEDTRLAGTRPALERWAAGQLPMVYGVGRTHNARGSSTDLRLVGDGHEYVLPGGGRAAEFAALLLSARDELSALMR